MFIQTPDDAPKNYGVINKTVMPAGKTPRQGKFGLPIKWVGGRVILYHNGEYTEDKRVLAQGNTGAIYTPKDWIGSEVIAFLITPPSP